jgi:hypothetical protein
MRRAISNSIQSSVSGDVVDLSARHADIHQLPLTQVVQAGSQPLALALLLKRTPISLEQAQDAPRRRSLRSGRILFRQSAVQRCCGIASGVGCKIRLLGWHRMLRLLCTAGEHGQTKGPVRCRRGLVKRSRRRILSARLLPRPSQSGSCVYGWRCAPIESSGANTTEIAQNQEMCRLLATCSGRL